MAREQGSAQGQATVPEKAPVQARQLSRFLCPFAFRCRWLYLWPL